MQRDRAWIMDIADSVGLILRYVSGMSGEDFYGDEVCQDAVIRRFEVIGEAAKRVSRVTRDRFDQVPWSAMARMRDRMIHGYDTHPD